MPTPLEQAEKKRADLRDALDKASDVNPPAGPAQKAIQKFRQVTRSAIDKLTVRIEKLRTEQQNAANAQPHVVLTRISPNQSARTSGIKLIVLHSTESNNIEASQADLAGVANWFANPSSQVSAHVIVDSDGHSAVCVQPDRKAWHCAAFNSASLGIENIGRASQTGWREAELDEAARWVAKWAKRYSIPLQRGGVSGGTVVKAGIVTHKDLGVAGGGHVDPGSAYPVGKVIEKAARLN